ncbi:unnamed protein product, partial [Timema podura]|nr:unnamed protein product [Timema podura]
TDYHEKQPLFDRGATAEPVRLTPAWEETNLPNDELNFKGVTMEQADLEMNPPKDSPRFQACKGLDYCNEETGCANDLLLSYPGIALCSGFWIAVLYFVDYKLSKEYTGIESNYVTNFLGYLGFAAQVPNLVFNWLNIFVQIGGNLTTRVVWSIFIEAVVFIITIILAMCNSSEWPGFFFWTTMITVVILNIQHRSSFGSVSVFRAKDLRFDSRHGRKSIVVANGVYQNTVFGMAAKLPFKYTGAVILGSNVSGTFTAIISLIASNHGT